MAEMSTRIGALLGLIGGTLLLINGLVGMTMARMSGYIDPDYPSFLFYITSGTTIAWSCIALYGTVKIYRDEKMGKKYLLIAGIVGIIATFIPIYFYDSGYGIQTFYLSSTFLYVDLVLIIVGGVLSYALAEKKEEER